ncbi:hypothetical protein T492DRAFT_851082 [Pavlovales sp. CCMP2436]|nr:hypothetical protein T492DRAFT_851082 [Pavlovales sp. CCMP2436]
MTEEIKKLSDDIIESPEDIHIEKPIEKPIKIKREKTPAQQAVWDKQILRSKKNRKKKKKKKQKRKKKYEPLHIDMSIVEELNEIFLDIPKFSVDNVLHSQIPKPLPNKSFSMAIVAPPGSASFSSMETNLFADHPRVYHDIEIETLQEIQMEIDEARKLGNNSLVIIDDFMVELNNKELQKILVRWIANRRHQKLSIIFLTQTFRSIPLNLRKNIGNWVFFKASSKRETESIAEEVGSEHHQFMFIDADQNVYKKFSKLTIK